MMSPYQHEPVLLKEVIKILKPKAGKVFIDCTLGGGGHAEEILKEMKSLGHLVGIDCDREAIEAGAERLAKYKNKVKFINGNFVNIKNIVKEQGFERVDGILFDLGVSSYQIDTPERGFSLRVDGPLDMRMDRSKSLTAAHLINNLDIEKLENIFRDFGEERFSRRIAKSIARERQKKHLTRTLQLVNLIKGAVPNLSPKKKLDSVTRIFQALRIAVNAELDNLKIALRDSLNLLKKNGRIAVISYHSLEDRIVKTIFKEEASDCICPPKVPVCVCGHKKIIKILTPKPITPKASEIKSNKRARSAKLRAAEKL